jgi:hypothetical protein
VGTAGQILVTDGSAYSPADLDADLVIVDAAGFSNNLSATDTDVQTALETIDAMTAGWPAGAANQVMQYDGAWGGKDDLTLPSGADRTITVAAVAGTADHLIVMAPEGGAGDDDGCLKLSDGTGNVGIQIGGASHGATESATYLAGDVRIYGESYNAAKLTIQVEYSGAARKLGFFGTAPIIKQDVGYYGNEGTDLAHCGTTLLALLNALVATGLITKHVIVA